MDLYMTTAHCRTNLSPIMEESPLESSASGFDSLILSLKSSLLLQDVRPVHKKYELRKIIRIEISSVEFLSSAIDALAATLQQSGELLFQDAPSKAGKQSKERYNRWNSNNDIPYFQRMNGGVRLNRDNPPKQPCRF